VSENAIGMGLGMLAIVAAWGIALVAFVGLGYAFLRWAGLEGAGEEGLLVAGWIGWALTICGLQAWQLFHPVDLSARGLLVGLGVAGLIWNWRILIAEAHRSIRSMLPHIAIAVLLAFWMANRAMAPEMPYDAGLYHLSTERWLLAYPIVPGLGNLYIRFAYNSSYFLYMAAMDVEPWLYRAQHVAAYLPVLAVAVMIAWTGCSLVRKRQPAGGQALFRFALIPAVVDRMFNSEQVGGPDLAVWALGIVVLDALVRVMLDALQGRQALTNFALLLTLASAATTVKLSAAPLGIAASVVGVVSMVRLVPRSPSLPDRWASRARMLVPSILLVAMWVLRGYVLSGYPAFPSALGGLNVDWRVPTEFVRAEARWIMSWARDPALPPEVVLEDWDWIGAWAKSVSSFDILAPLVVAGLLLIVAVVRRRPWGRAARWLATAVIPPAVALSIWFITAPDPRFAGAAAWLVAACGVLLAAERWGLWKSRAFVLGMLLVAIAVGGVLQLEERITVPPGPYWGFSPLPQSTLVEEQLASGLTVLRPAQGDQCWVAPLLCTPGLLPNLSLRVAGDRSRGFRAITSSARN